METTYKAFCMTNDNTHNAIFKQQLELLLLMQAIGGANDNSFLHFRN